MRWSLKKVLLTAVILMAFTSSILAEDREIKQSEDTIRVIKGKVSLLSFPDSVIKCVVDRGIDAVISGKNVYITAGKEGRIFVSLSHITVPLVLRFSKSALASYNFYYRGITSYADTSFYNEIASVISAMFNDDIISNYALKKPNKQVNIELGKKKYSGTIERELLGNYFGYVIEFSKRLDSIPENLFYQPGIVAIAVDGKKAYILADRELYPEEKE